MKSKLFTLVVLSLLAVLTAFAQPPQPGSPGPRSPRPPRPDGAHPPGPSPQGEWTRPHDTNGNGTLEHSEFQAAMERTFAEIDRNGSGTIESEEGIHPHPHPRPATPPDDGPPSTPGATRPPPRPDGKRLLPPFFFVDRLTGGQTATRAEFDQHLWNVFNGMDKNGDRMLTRDEARLAPGLPGVERHEPLAPPRPPARLDAFQFGDKFVPGQPFSAETVIEDTRRLFDGTTTRKEVRGEIYRDGAGRTRRELPLDVVTRFSASPSDTARVEIVFINDFPAKTQYSLDQGNKVARKSPIWSNNWPFPEMEGPDHTKTVILGSKMIEGVKADGTSTTREIPAGHLGNEKPLLVVTERWFSPELQVVVMSRHLDPLSGEHIFRLVNIKLGEPAASLFSVPAGYRIENATTPRPRE